MSTVVTPGDDEDVGCLDDNMVSAYLSRSLSERDYKYVVSHLSTCDACLTITSAALTDDEEPPEAARTIGRYTLLAMLGQGATASIYLAHDPVHGRDVALKVMQPHAYSSERLSRDANSLVRVRHPNLVVVHDCGDVDEGGFIAMEIVEGESLTRWLERRRPWNEIFRVFVAAGRGVAAAHAAGVDRVAFGIDNVLFDRTRVVTTLRVADGPAPTDLVSFASALHEALYGAAPGAAEFTPDRDQAPARIRDVLFAAACANGARSMNELLDQLERRARPRRTMVAVVGALASFAATFSIVASGRSHPHPTPVATVETAKLLPALVYVAPFTNMTGDVNLDDSLDMVASAVLGSSVQIEAIAGVDLQPLDVQHAGASTLIVRGTVRRSATSFVIDLDVTADERAIFRSERVSMTRDDLVAATRSLTIDLVRALGEPPPSQPVVLSTSTAAIHAWMLGQRDADQANAIRRYEQALALDPNFVAARAALGVSLAGAGRSAEAVVAIERAFRTPERIPARQLLALDGVYFHLLGRYREEVGPYQELLARWPEDPRTQGVLTEAAIRAGDFPLALKTAKTRSIAPTEAAWRNLLIAELGNELLADVSRDGGAMLAETPEPDRAAVAALGAAYALLGRHDTAIETLRRLETVDPAFALRATADLAVFEGRLDDALAALRTTITPSDHLLLATLWLRRGDLPRARAAARLAMVSGTLRTNYLAVSTALAAGDATAAADAVFTWQGAREADRQLYGHLLAGDIARSMSHWSEALDEYRAASLLGDDWIIHDRLARGFVGAGDLEAANREVAWCLDHRGQAALFETPSLSLLPELYLERARIALSMHADAKQIRAAYEAVAVLGRSAQHDPWTDEARRRLEQLAR